MTDLVVVLRSFWADSRPDEAALDPLKTQSWLRQVAKRAFEWLSPVYTYIFLLVRSLIAPPTIAWFAISLQQATALPASCR